MSVILFVFGAIVGSFLNVVGSRWGSGLGFVGRSFCDSCHRKLKWWELVPLVSFFALRGRCSGCKTRISRQHLAVEVLTGLIFATVPIYYLPIFCIYIIISIYDLRHKVIPDSLVYSAIILSLVVPLFIVNYSLLDWLAGPIIFIFFASIWFISRGRAIGFGDAKLGLSVGILLGAAQGFSAVVLTFWIGTAGVLIYMLLSRKKLTMKSEVPLGPFLVVGAWLSLIYDLNLLQIPQ
ncbi:MAG: prepilin peptidase [bacterium]|nr:prepilin peptidase [bacterium]